MGDYTGLRGTIELKHAHRAKVQNNLDTESNNVWDGIIDSESLYMNDSRCSFIPFGSLCYMPDDWEFDFGFDRVTGTMSFSCSLKNYNRTISKFIDTLPDIADAWDLESYDEIMEEYLYFKN